MVDENPATRAELALAISLGGYSLLTFESWQLARSEMAKQSPRVVVLTDWRGNGGRGMYRRLRHASAGAPFVMVCDGGVTEWDERFTRVLHYPVAREVLLGALGEVIAGTAAMVIRLGEFRLDQRTGVLHHGERSVGLTPIQVSLLGALMRADGEVLPTDELAEAGWPGHNTDDRRVLYTHMAWLRERLCSFAPAAAIVNRRGRGYQFVVPPPIALPGDRAGG